jgi:hypothetical protein
MIRIILRTPVGFTVGYARCLGGGTHSTSMLFISLGGCGRRRRRRRGLGGGGGTFGCDEENNLSFFLQRGSHTLSARGGRLALGTRIPPSTVLGILLMNHWVLFRSRRHRRRLVDAERLPHGRLRYNSYYPTTESTSNVTQSTTIVVTI